MNAAFGVRFLEDFFAADFFAGFLAADFFAVFFAPDFLAVFFFAAISSPRGVGKAYFSGQDALSHLASKLKHHVWSAIGNYEFPL
jgi:hypothetical protein